MTSLRFDLVDSIVILFLSGYAEFFIKTSMFNQRNELHGNSVNTKKKLFKTRHLKTVTHKRANRTRW